MTVEIFNKKYKTNCIIKAVSLDSFMLSKRTGQYMICYTRFPFLNKLIEELFF